MANNFAWEVYGPRITSLFELKSNVGIYITDFQKLLVIHFPLSIIYMHRFVFLICLNICI